MAQPVYKVSVPGSMMLMGEHAVLLGKAAIVCAVDKRIHLTLTPNASKQISISDTKLGVINLDLKQITIRAPFQFVLSAIMQFRSHIKTGFNLEIKAEFSSVLGLGSSAAVTAGTVAVLGEWLHGKPMAKKKIYTMAKKAVLAVQGLGSGADLAASIYGGVLAYQIKPLKIVKLPEIENLTAVYCGYKTPTSEVVQRVNAAKKLQPKLFNSIFAAMHICVQRAIVAIKSNDMATLGSLFMQHQGLQYALGVSSELIDVLVRQLNACKGIYGAKISGSGLGDCIVGVGKVADGVFPRDSAQHSQGVVQIAIGIDSEGLSYVQ